MFLFLYFTEEHKLEFCEKSKLEGAVIFLHEPSNSLNNFTCSCTATSNDRLKITTIDVVTNKTVNAFVTNKTGNVSTEEITNFLKLNEIIVNKTGLFNFPSNDMINMTFHKETNETYKVWLKISCKAFYLPFLSVLNLKLNIKLMMDL